MITTQNSVDSIYELLFGTVYFAVSIVVDTQKLEENCKVMDKDQHNYSIYQKK